MMNSNCGKCEAMRAKLEPIALLVLRLFVGVVMAIHGWQKLQDPDKFIGFLGMLNVPSPQIAGYLAIAGEFLGGIGLAIGLLTPIAAFGIAATMAVAVAQVHWANGLLAQNNGYEYPAMILLLAVYFIVKGAGCISLDGVLKAKFCKDSDPGYSET